jgi:hypothetical protein
MLLLMLTFQESSTARPAESEHLVRIIDPLQSDKVYY